MKKSIIRIILFLVFFISILSPLSSEELWGSLGTGVGFLPGEFSSVSLVNVGGVLDFGLHGLFNTPLRSDLEISYAGYLPSEDSTGWIEGMHGLQGVFLLSFQGVLGDLFVLTPRAGIGGQLLFTSSAATQADYQAGLYTSRLGTQVVVLGGFAVDIIISKDWRIGLEGDYRMLAEVDGLHHGASAKLVLNRKLAEFGKKSKTNSSEKPLTSPAPTETMTIDKLVPLKGLKDVLVFQTENQVTIILLNAFPAYDTAMTGPAGENLAIAGEYLEAMHSSKISFYGYVAEVQEDDEASDRELSFSRAAAVRDWLVLNGYIDEAKETIAEGRSGSNPIGDNSTSEGRALNRRVEIVIDLHDEGGRK